MRLRGDYEGRIVEVTSFSWLLITDATIDEIPCDAYRVEVSGRNVIGPTFKQTRDYSCVIFFDVDGGRSRVLLTNVGKPPRNLHLLDWSLNITPDVDGSLSRANGYGVADVITEGDGGGFASPPPRNPPTTPSARQYATRGH